MPIGSSVKDSMKRPVRMSPLPVVWLPLLVLRALPSLSAQWWTGAGVMPMYAQPVHIAAAPLVQMLTPLHSHKEGVRDVSCHVVWSYVSSLPGVW